MNNNRRPPIYARFHRPAALARTRQFYVVFAPGNVAGVYLAWYQVSRLNGVQQQAFDTPEAAIAAYEEWYWLEHGDNQPDPPPPSERFTVEAYREFMRQVGSNSVYRQPDQPQASERMPVALSTNAPEPSVPGTPAPPYTLPSPPSSSAGRSSQLPASPRSQPGAAPAPRSPPPSPSTSRPHRSSSHRAAHRHSQSSSAPSTQHHTPSSKQRTALAGGSANTRAPAPIPFTSPSSRAPAPIPFSSSSSRATAPIPFSSPSSRATAPIPFSSPSSRAPAPITVASSSSAASSRPHTSTPAPSAGAPSGDARRGRSQAASSVASSSRDVADWVESTSAAMERMSIRPVEVIEAEGVADLPDDATSYVVGGEGLVPMVFNNWRDAHEAGERLRASGIMTSRLRTARSREERLRLIESFR